MVSLEGGQGRGGGVEILKIVRGHEIFWSQHGGHEIFQVTLKGSRDIPGFYKNPSRPGGMYHLCQFPKSSEYGFLSFFGFIKHFGVFLSIFL